jgi:hypothetical protein
MTGGWMAKWAKRLVVGAAVVFVAIQLIRPARTNPPIDPAQEISAKISVDPAVASIFSRSCDDCHSNRTVWPWYSNVAPVSWLVIRDVDDGRRHMNLSNFVITPPRREARILQNICQQVRSGGMPMKIYVPMHPLSKLASGDIDAICRWTDATLATLPADARTPEGPRARP